MRPGPQLKYIQVEQICHEPALVPARVYAEYVRLTFLQIREMAGRAPARRTPLPRQFVQVYIYLLGFCVPKYIYLLGFCVPNKTGILCPKICVCAAGGNMLVWYLLKSVKCIDIGCVQACSPVQTTRVCISTHVLTCVQAKLMGLCRASCNPYVCVCAFAPDWTKHKQAHACMYMCIYASAQTNVCISVCM